MSSVEELRDALGILLIGDGDEEAAARHINDAIDELAAARERMARMEQVLARLLDGDHDDHCDTTFNAIRYQCNCGLEDAARALLEEG